MIWDCRRVRRSGVCSPVTLSRIRPARCFGILTSSSSLLGRSVISGLQMSPRSAPSGMGTAVVWVQIARFESSLSLPLHLGAFVQPHGERGIMLPGSLCQEHRRSLWFPEQRSAGCPGGGMQFIQCPQDDAHWKLLPRCSVSLSSNTRTTWAMYCIGVKEFFILKSTGPLPSPKDAIAAARSALLPQSSGSPTLAVQPTFLTRDWTKFILCWAALLGSTSAMFVAHYLSCVYKVLGSARKPLNESASPAHFRAQCSRHSVFFLVLSELTCWVLWSSSISWSQRKNADALGFCNDGRKPVPIISAGHDTLSPLKLRGCYARHMELFGKAVEISAS